MLKDDQKEYVNYVLKHKKVTKDYKLLVAMVIISALILVRGLWLPEHYKLAHNNIFVLAVLFFIACMVSIVLVILIRIADWDSFKHIKTNFSNQALSECAENLVHSAYQKQSVWMTLLSIVPITCVAGYISMGWLTISILLSVAFMALAIVFKSTNSRTVKLLESLSEAKIESLLRDSKLRYEGDKDEAQH